jgi:archaellum component FlaF (FlaF/FlaG flagellin family)
MKKSKILVLSIMLFGAFLFVSCSSGNEKVKAEKVEVECTHEHEKEHECDEAMKDTCATTKAEAHECEHKKEKTNETQE